MDKFKIGDAVNLIGGNVFGIRGVIFSSGYFGFNRKFLYKVKCIIDAKERIIEKYEGNLELINKDWGDGE